MPGRSPLARTTEKGRGISWLGLVRSAPLLPAHIWASPNPNTANVPASLPGELYGTMSEYTVMAAMPASRWLAGIWIVWPIGARTTGADTGLLRDDPAPAIAAPPPITRTAARTTPTIAAVAQPDL